MPRLSHIPVLMSKGLRIFPLNLPRNLWLFLVLITYFCFLFENVTHIYNLFSYTHLTHSSSQSPHLSFNSMSSLIFKISFLFLRISHIYIYNVIWSYTETNKFPPPMPLYSPKQSPLRAACMFEWAGPFTETWVAC